MTEFDFMTKSFEHEETVLIGSTGLGIQMETSDIDICVLERNLTLDQQAALIGAKKIGGYDDSLLMKHSTLYKLDDLDIFVFTDPLKLIVVEAVMKMMNTYPKIFLRIKWLRIKTFRYLLEKHGFLL